MEAETKISLTVCRPILITIQLIVNANFDMPIAPYDFSHQILQQINKKKLHSFCHHFLFTTKMDSFDSSIDVDVDDNAC